MNKVLVCAKFEFWKLICVCIAYVVVACTVEKQGSS